MAEPSHAAGAVAPAAHAEPFPGERPVTAEVVREHNLNELEYDRILAHARPHADADRAGHLLRPLVGALLLQALASRSSGPSPPPAPTWCRARARTPACCACRRAGRWRSRSSRTTTPPPSSRTRARPPGVGGILRDVFTMGARPVAVLNSLRFGPLDQARNRYLFGGVVRGVGDYGNCVGVPTLGGEVGFAPGYTGNPLVNAMCVGLLREEDLMRASAHGVGNVLLAVGARTGRDGIHGASFASEELSEKSEARRPQVQVGDPFTEKLLLEATLELIESDLIVAVQDMGAAGLTSSSAEMAARGGVGVELDTGLVPVRESGMTPYEIMLSESQERMLVVAEPAPRGRDPGGLRQVGARRHAGRAGDRRRDLPGGARRAAWSPPSPASRWWTTAPSTSRKRGRAMQAARRRGGAPVRRRPPVELEEALRAPARRAQHREQAVGLRAVRFHRAGRHGAWPRRRRRRARGGRHRLRARAHGGLQRAPGGARPLRGRQGRGRRGRAQHRLHRRLPARHHRLPQFRQSREARRLLPVPRGVPRHRATHAARSRRR